MSRNAAADALASLVPVLGSPVTMSIMLVGDARNDGYVDVLEGEASHPATPLVGVSVIKGDKVLVLSSRAGLVVIGRLP